MYLDESKVTIKGKVYERALLRVSYREKGRILKRTIANLSKCSKEEIQAIRFALKNKMDISGFVHKQKLTKGQSVGAIFVLQEIAKKLGIKKELGNNRNGSLALWQIMARIIAQGSRLSAVRLASQHAVCDILNLDSFHEEHLYSNLNWLQERQDKIEKALFQSNSNLFLYDVTSSYFEGDQNELAAYGYNRDGKKGKKQIVIGLLTDSLGSPVSIQVFPGNTTDSKTFVGQVEKVKERFKVKNITFVGDRGMIKKTEEIEGINYITAITKPQIEKLLKNDVIQMKLFDKDVCEIEDKNVRYILRKNPYREKEIDLSRKSKIKSIEKLLEKQNKYLKEHPKAKIETAIKKIESKIKNLKTQSFLKAKNEKRTLFLETDKKALEDTSKLDGCYVIKTNLSSETSSEIVHHRYKDLALVEQGFRTMKTAHLETRPYYLRKEKRTRAHVFIVMLAYKIIRHLKEAWKELEITVEEGISELSSICAMKTSLSEGYQIIPKTTGLTKKLLEKLDINLPNMISNRKIVVSTKKKLVSER
jgi:transposase